MKTKQTSTKRRFATTGQQINYLREKLLFWIYEREKPTRAIPYATRLHKLLKETDANEESLVGQECRALIFEAQGDLPAAIRHREAEIGKIHKLHGLTFKDAQQRKWACQAYGADALSDRLDLLAILYDQAGNPAGAIRILQESKELCKKHRLPFEAQEVLEELDRDLAQVRKGKHKRA